MRQIKIGDMGELLCPRCERGNTHLELVMVHAQREDRPGVDVIVQVQTGEHSVTREIPTTRRRALANGTWDEWTEGSCGTVPSPIWASGRRDHTILRFTCESCPQAFDMRFEQHKGETYTGWSL